MGTRNDGSGLGWEEGWRNATLNRENLTGFENLLGLASGGFLAMTEGLDVIVMPFKTKGNF